ncbi:glycosyltransferase [Bacteriovoracaceae bacterium]|nr:glycosyltransferase [Bacteriovoracaceae bacterium]
MKVVILHDWLTGFRGGERVLEAICEMFPEAPIYTLIHQKDSTSPTIERREIVTSFLDRIPGIYQNYRKFLPLMPMAASSMKIRHEADLVISSSHCVIKGIKKPEGSVHISYVHSPMRYIYDQFDNYFGHASFPIRMAAHLCRPYLQWWDRRSNKNVDRMLANSNFVRERIKTYYNLDVEVLHPFVDLKDFPLTSTNDSNKKAAVPEKENFYLMVTAFAPNKKVDLAIEAFNQNKLPLKIIGSGSQEDIKRLKDLSKSNIEFLGFLSREEVVAHYHKAKAFIFPGVEDFGITPLEALAAGTPVIGYGKAGLLETQTKKTGNLFYEPSADSLNDAISNISCINQEDLISRAQEFSKERFQVSLNIIIKTLIDSRSP